MGARLLFSSLCSALWEPPGGESSSRERLVNEEGALMFICLDRAGLVMTLPRCC